MRLRPTTCFGPIDPLLLVTNLPTDLFPGPGSIPKVTVFQVSFSILMAGGPLQGPSEGKLQPPDRVKTDPKIHRFSKSIFWVLRRGPWRIRLAKVTTLSAKMKVFSRNRRQYCTLAPSDPPGAPNEASLGLQNRLLAPIENMHFA